MALIEGTGPVQHRRRIGTVGVPAALLPGQLAINDPQNTMTRARLYAGTAPSAMYPSGVATLVSDQRQVELIGDQTITGNKTISIGNLKVTGGAPGNAIETDGFGNLTWGPGATNILPEPPPDGQIYGRDGQTATWIPVLPLAGGKMTGMLLLSGPPNPTGDPTQAVDLGYVTQALHQNAQFLGTLDAPVGEVFYTPQSGISGNALVPAIGVNGAFVVCINAGTIPVGGPAAGMSLNEGDWLYSDGTKWDPINIAGGGGGGGSITGVTAGNGLTGGGVTGNVTVALTVPVSVANGGTGSTTNAGGLDSLAGFSGTQAGIMERTSAGAYVTLADPLPIAHGGTSATVGNAGLDNLAGISGGNSGLLSRNNSGVYSLTPLPLSLVNGGTGASSQAGALTSLGALPIAGGTMTGPLNVPSINVTGPITANSINLGSPLPIASGGTGATTGNTAFDSLLGVSGSTTGNVQRSSSGVYSLVTQAPPLVVSDTSPPLSQGALWYDSTNLQLNVGYNDGNSIQWVVANAANAGPVLPLAITQGGTGATTAAASPFVQKAGDTMTGALTVNTTLGVGGTVPADANAGVTYHGSYLIMPAAAAGALAANWYPSATGSKVMTTGASAALNINSGSSGANFIFYLAASATAGTAPAFALALQIDGNGLSGPGFTLPTTGNATFSGTINAAASITANYGALPADAAQGIFTGNNYYGYSSTAFVCGLYYSSSAQWKYIQNTAGGLIGGANGGWNIYTAPSGTAGAVATLAETVQIYPNGTIQVNDQSSGIDQNTFIGQTAAGSDNFFRWIGARTWGAGVKNSGDPSIPGGWLVADYNAGQQRLNINAAGVCTSSSAWGAISDAGVKTAIVDQPRGLADILKVKPRKYRYNGKAGLEGDGQGFIAQELAEVMPELVRPGLSSTDGKETYLAVVETGLIGPLVNAIKELAAKIEALEKRKH